MRRRVHRQHAERRVAEQSARRQVAAACRAVTICGAAIVRVTRCLALSERTVRRWRGSAQPVSIMPRGRPPRCASRADRNLVYQFLKERGAVTPLVSVRAAFPRLRRADLADVLRRFRRAARRRAQRQQSRLEWRRPGAVWAADFKERREPIEGRYGWILSIKDLGSGYQLAWQPLVDATAAMVQAAYQELFDEHGPPLVLKSDNGGQFKADETKGLLAQYQVVPLYSPKRHPQYNGAVERANGQVSGYQEALAAFHARPAGPTLADAEGARRLANDLAHPRGWRGASADTLWNERAPLAPHERETFQATLARCRHEVAQAWQFPAGAVLSHDQAAAVDRRAVRNALVAHDLLRIHPRRSTKTRRGPSKSAPKTTTRALGAGRIELAQQTAPPIVGGATDHERHEPPMVFHSFEEVHSSANKSTAGGQD